MKAKNKVKKSRSLHIGSKHYVRLPKQDPAMKATLANRRDCQVSHDYYEQLQASRLPDDTQSTAADDDITTPLNSTQPLPG